MYSCVICQRTFTSEDTYFVCALRQGMVFDMLRHLSALVWCDPYLILGLQLKILNVVD